MDIVERRHRTATPARTYRFAAFALDGGRGAVIAPDGAETALRPKTADVLCLLAENAGRLVSRETLMHSVWPDVFVTDDSVTQCVTEIRRALGDEGARLLRTMPKRGYLLDAPAPAPEGIAPLRAERASLVVLPFADPGGDPAQDYFAEAITEELTTALARVKWFHVVAPDAAFARPAADVREVGRALGVRYVLEGSVRRAGGRLRITGQLLEAATGRHIWVDRFEGAAEDVFALQDAVAEAVAGAVEPLLERAEIERVRAKPAGRLDAYELYLRSLPLRHRLTRDANDEAMALLRRAIALDPDFAPAKAHAVICIIQRAAQRWLVPGNLEEGARLAREACAAHGEDPRVLASAADGLGCLAYDLDGAQEAAMRAVALNPNSAWARYAAGWTNKWGGFPDAAIVHFQRALRLSPHDMDAPFGLAGLGYARLMQDSPAEALQFGERALRLMPAMAAGHRVVIAALDWLGRREDASAAALRFRGFVPNVRAAGNFRQLYRDQAFAERVIRSYRDAGLPD